MDYKMSNSVYSLIYVIWQTLQEICSCDHLGDCDPMFNEPDIDRHACDIQGWNEFEIPATRFRNHLGLDREYFELENSSLESYFKLF